MQAAKFAVSHPYEVFLSSLKNPRHSSDQFESIYDHMYFYFTTILKMSPAEARQITDKYKSGANEPT